MGDQTSKPKSESRDGPRPDKPRRISPRQLPPPYDGEFKSVALQEPRLGFREVRERFFRIGWNMTEEDVRKVVRQIRAHRDEPKQPAAAPKPAKDRRGTAAPAQPKEREKRPARTVQHTTPHGLPPHLQADFKDMAETPEVPAVDIWRHFARLGHMMSPGTVRREVGQIRREHGIAGKPGRPRKPQTESEGQTSDLALTTPAMRIRVGNVDITIRLAVDQQGTRLA